MAVVLEAVAFGMSRREREDRIETIEVLNGGLLVNVKDNLLSANLWQWSRWNPESSPTGGKRI